MKKYIIIVLSLLCVIQGIAEETKPISIRGNSTFPPYEFINDKNEPDGFNVDLIRAIMDELKLSYDLQLENWSEILPLFENNQVDLLTGIARVEERESKFNFSKWHSFIDYTIVCRKDSPIQSASDLQNKSIIVLKYSVPYEKLKSMSYDHKLIIVDNISEGLKLLSAGKGDAAICPDNTANYIIYKNGLTNLNIINARWPLREYCFTSNNAELLGQIDAILFKLKGNGVYDQIHAKWLGTESVFPIPVWVYFLIGILLLIALFLCIFIRVYKRQLKKGEALLKTENEKLNTILLENKCMITRYLTVFNTTLVGLCYYDKDGILVNINDTMIHFMGLDIKQEELIDKRICIYENPILRNNEIIDEQNNIHEFHGIIKYDTRQGHCPEYFANFAPQEGIFFYKVDVMPIRKTDGTIEGLLITAIDQTAEKNHAGKLEEEEAKLNLALEAGNIAAWMYNPDTRIFITLSGSAIAGKGLSLEDNISILHPDDRAMQKALFDDFLQGEKDFAETTFRYIHKDGSYHYYDSRMIVKKEDGKVVAILGTQKDITKEVINNKILNNSIQQLRFAIQTANMALWVYDCKTQAFTSYNDPIADYKDEALIPLATYDNYFQQEDTNREQLENAALIMANGEDKPYTFTAKLRTKYDSEWQYCTTRGLPFEKDENDKVIKYLGVRLNITDQIRYQQILEQEKSEAQQADKLKSMFLANMSHEIRTPLNAIVGFSELLQTTNDNEERAEYINIINRNNELLLRLINDILDLSKIESGYIELKPEIFDLSEVFEETFTTLKQRCINPDVKFLGYNPYKSCKIKLDKNRLVQVGTNFITNALKHTTKGHILMGYEYMDGGVKIYVEDTGCGISKEKQSQLFQRFTKLDDFTQGTGLGLAICKAIADAKNGKIGMESEEGKGSMFWAWFPCKAEIEEHEKIEEI